ncbi:PPR: pentatricopeptide repeat domain containing protein [Nitzschia inconspicua]|uniref:PPR: pentatricopeptide repeat domain containing protein n=1 Tax=Nitzschia inconspicua TaxID=303405 RepID=A0A9K3LLY8_9STRA|nr:PPR: pentatricopeptide repeat domain containing protein [Nitzschia inconspicua]
MPTRRFCRNDSIAVVSLAVVFLLWVQNRGCCTSFTFSANDGIRTPSSVKTTRLNVLTEPPRSGPGIDGEFQRHRSTSNPSHRSPKTFNGNYNQSNRRTKPMDDIVSRNYPRNQKQNNTDDSPSKWQNAIRVEQKLYEALDALQMQSSASSAALSSLPSINGTDVLVRHLAIPIPFPSIRDCNAALATFGDCGDLLRALRLYFKMRKASSLIQRKGQSITTSPQSTKLTVPTPTLVTYSTLMSRAISLGKPKIALRVWKIMTRQPEFFASSMLQLQEQRFRRDVIVPDVKSANILMNCYSKLGDIEAAEDLMNQMLSVHGGKDVPSLSPNLVTFNTLLDACHKTGELDKALYWKGRLDDAGRGNRFLQPDARTYTSLIASVARKAGQTSSGTNDPSLAFRLLQEMKSVHHIQPNAMTYSALIDVCGRCKRCDLALQALRLMLDDEKQQQQQNQGNNNSKCNRKRVNPSAVGAWTSTINACGKAGRIDTAMKLFFESMPRFGVQPNTVTCGCLTDSLLRHDRVRETLDVLQYMKANDIALNEVMYTSLMTYASRLAGKEQSSQPNLSENPKAVHIYSELMSTVLQNKGNNPPARFRKGKNDPLVEQLFQVSLVFQEMKATGVQPDLATYNVLLRSIANVGDVNRALEVLKKIQDDDGLEPNNRTWKEVLRAAGKAKRSDVVLKTWNAIVAEYDVGEKSSKNSNIKLTPRHRHKKKQLNCDVLQAFLKALLICAWDVRESDKHASFHLCKLVIKSYHGLLSGSEFLGMRLFSSDDVLSNSHIMALFVQAVVTLETLLRSHIQEQEEEPTKRLLECTQLRRLGISLSKEKSLDVANLPLSLQKNHHFGRALRTCQCWKEDIDIPQ